MRELLKELGKPVAVFLIVIAAGGLLLSYSIKHTAGAEAQTGGGTMGSYELNFITSKEESYVTLTSFFFDKKTISYSNDSLSDWRIYNPAFIWHFNKKTQAWEDVTGKK